MIIEFFGLPGSGKTTLCNELLIEHNCFPLPKFNQFKKYEVFLVIFSFKFWSFNFYALLLYFVSEDWCIKNYYLLINLYLKYMLINKKYNSNYYCTDHGIIQTISSMNFTKLKFPKIVVRMIKMLNININILGIYLYCDDFNVIIKRIKSRGNKKRINMLSDIQMVNALTNQKKLFDLVSDSLMSVKKIEAFKSVFVNKSNILNGVDLDA